MNKRLIIIVLAHLFLFQFATAQFHADEKRISKNKVSKEIKDYVEQKYSGYPVKYYRLKTDEVPILYEAKVKTKEGKINLVFSEAGQFIREDAEIEYQHGISKETRKKINKTLDEKISTHRVTECRLHKIGERITYELDILVAKKRYRFSFEENGTLIDYKVIPEKPIDLIFN